MPKTEGRLMDHRTITTGRMRWRNANPFTNESPTFESDDGPMILEQEWVYTNTGKMEWRPVMIELIQPEEDAT